MKSSRHYTDPSGTPDWSPADEAAFWALRHDRGLTAAEQDEFSQWLAADARHGAVWAEHRWGWDELDRLAGLQTSIHAVPDPDLLAPRRRHVRRFAFSSLLAAGVAVVVFLAMAEPVKVAPVAAPPPAATHTLALIEQRELPDGSVLLLNRGAVVTEHYTAAERRIRLERGEVHFKVAKDANRPFFVEAGEFAVRAVGTAFNVRLDSASVEILVTEGQVSVADPTALNAAPLIARLGVNERTVVSLAPSAPPPEVATVAPAEIEARLAWQPRLLDFTETPLAVIVREFNRRNPVRLTLADPGLGTLQLSATFRSDNVEGFVRLMESDFGMHAEWRSADEIVLRRSD